MIDFADLNIEIVENDGVKGIFKIGPLPKGYGQTLSNSLRRVLLSSLPGGAVTSMKIAGISHEYSTIKGVKETVVDMTMNIKGIGFRCDSNKPQVVRVSMNKAGDVLAGDLMLTESVSVMNPKHKIATITDSKTVLDLEMVVERDIGYRVADESLRAEVGRLPVDASFGPVERVMFSIDETRKGKRMDLDMVTLTVFTDGSIDPKDAIGSASDVLCSVFGKLKELIGSDELIEDEDTDPEEKIESSSREEIENWGVEDINISKRTKASLIGAGIDTVGAFVKMSSKELLEIPGFGKKALSDIDEFRKEYGLVE